MKTTSLTIDLPQPLKTFVDDQVATGDFATAADYICVLLREAQKQKVREHVDQLLLAGLNSGPATPMTAQDWEDIRREALERLAQERAHEPTH